ncbi:MAG: SPOR domain-containing protein [Gammaproteobacteria bacterium]|nr:SPOR domain-containing protein [Gammaproteobacteria bacterium]
MKERIIGAAVLVVFAVLVVPIFLDGPPADGEVVTERVLLPGQEDQKTQTVVLDRDRKDPVPSATTPVPAQQESVVEETARDEPQPAAVQQTEPEKAPEQEPETPEPKPAATQPAASTTGMWAVQIGSYSNKENAEKVAAGLRKQGYAAFLSQVETDAGQLHRVRIGPQKDRASAEAMASRLAKVGHKGQVMPHP